MTTASPGRRSFQRLNRAEYANAIRDVLAPGGCWVAMKGRRPDDELQALGSGRQVFHVEPLQVPALDAERCLVWIAPASGPDAQAIPYTPPPPRR